MLAAKCASELVTSGRTRGGSTSHSFTHSLFSYENQRGAVAVMHWSVFSPNSYVEVLTPNRSACDLIA